MPLSTDALLLRANDYRDSDRIVTLFTRDAGKLSALARGARGSKRRFAGSLEPYSVIRVELEEGRGELLTLKRAELVQPFVALLSELDRMEAAAGALALVREAHGPRVVDAELFVAAVQYLTVIDHEGDPQRGLLLSFALRVLTLMGVAPGLAACGRSGEAVPADKGAYFDPAIGAVVSRKYGGGPFLLSAATRGRMMRAQAGQWLDRTPWEATELATARGAIVGFLRVHAKDELGSRLYPHV